MKELIEKIVEKIKNKIIYVDERCLNEINTNGETLDFSFFNGEKVGYQNALKIIQEEAQAYNESVKGDLISRKETIQRFIYEVETSKSYMFHINTIKRLLQDIEKPTAYNDGWIPVSSGKFPKDVDFVIYTHKDGEVDVCSIEYFYDYLDKFVAWQPLPETYQPKGE